MDRSLRDLLLDRLRPPLPGRASQVRFAPELGFGRHFAEPPASARRAAVIALLYPIETEPLTTEPRTESPLDCWRIPLIVRPDHLEHHAGQIALPGGMIEAGESSAAAALRELHEELGVPRDGIELLGELSPIYVFASDNFVSPWVAMVSPAPTFNLSVDEVAAVIELPICTLVDESSVGSEVREQRGVRFRAPYFRCGPHRIWGATAMILAEFAAILDRARMPRNPQRR
jgi:8-oxo-dGTP pyrophosphatase MutT (NUDIX family)